MSSISSIAYKDVLLAGVAGELLGYRRKTEVRPLMQLLNSVRVWRRNWRTRDGVIGKDLLNWQSPEDREQLQQMTIDYLDAGHGAELWPATGYPSPRVVPEYPIDKDKIIPLLCQIFWRQNTNEVSNNAYLANARQAKLEAQSATLVQHDSTKSSLQKDGSPPSQCPPSLLESDRRMKRFNIGNKPFTANDRRFDDDSNVAKEMDTLSSNFPAPAQQQTCTPVESNAVTVEKRLKPMPSDDVLEWVDTEDEEEIRRNREALVSFCPSFLRQLRTSNPSVSAAKTAISDKRRSEQHIIQQSLASDYSDGSISSEDDSTQRHSPSPAPSSDEELCWTMETRSSVRHKSELLSGTTRKSVANDSAKYQPTPVRSRRETLSSPGLVEDSRPCTDEPRHFLQDIQRNADAQVQQQINYSTSKTVDVQSPKRLMGLVQTPRHSTSASPTRRASLETERVVSVSNTSIASQTERDAENTTSKPAKRAKVISSDSTAKGNVADDVRNWANTLLKHQDVQGEVTHEVEHLKHKPLYSDDRTSALSNETGLQRRTAAGEQQIPYIRFVIVTTFRSRPCEIAWHIQSLRDRTAEDVFVHVSKLIKQNTQCLLFRLYLSEKTSMYLVDRGNEDYFMEMRRRFSEAIRKDIRQTNKREYLIEIVPELEEEEQAGPTADDDNSEGEGVQIV